MSVCHKLQIASFLFLGGIEPFWPPFFHVPLYKTLFFDFWFRPPNAQNLLPKICTKSPISRLVWQIDRRCLGLPGGFRGWPIQWNHAKCCGADPCCHGNDIWARRGDPVAYRLVLVSVDMAAKIQDIGLTKLICALYATLTWILKLGIYFPLEWTRLIGRVEQRLQASNVVFELTQTIAHRSNSQGLVFCQNFIFLSSRLWDQDLGLQDYTTSLTIL